MYVLYDDTRSFIHEMNDDRIMSRTCLRQRSVIITEGARRVCRSPYCLTMPGMLSALTYPAVVPHNRAFGVGRGLFARRPLGNQ